MCKRSTCTHVLAPRVSAIHTCAPNQFLCDNKKCIPYVWKCDNDHDCGADDKSDEPADCVTAQPCRAHYIKCRSTGRCIPETWKCDGDKDCGILDDTDEPVGECSKWCTFVAFLGHRCSCCDSSNNQTSFSMHHGHAPTLSLLSRWYPFFPDLVSG